MIPERVLAALLLEAGKRVSVSHIIAAVWEGEPPATALHQIHKAIARLRKHIPGGGEVIVTEGPGYRAVLTVGQLDLLEFQDGVHEADRALAEGRREDAVALLRSALALWRGPVMSGTGGPVINTAALSWEDRRIVAAELFFGLRLDLGEAGELVADLRDLVTRHPLRESLRGRLMVALHHSGRRAEALDEYRQARELLVEELGIDPGPKLAQLYEDMLHDSVQSAPPSSPSAPVTAPTAPAGPADGVDPASAERVGAVEHASPAVRPPCSLPHDLADFSGREDVLRTILASVHAGSGDEGHERRVRIVGLDGMGGSGKTSLAVHVAHRLTDAFPDGQLHVDMHGYTPGDAPLKPAKALETLLRTLGTPVDAIPDDLEGRVVLWRTLLQKKRILLLLDNALDAAQIRPLLPAAPCCLAIVTSRARLIDLDGAEWFSIGVMSPGDSARFVAATLGEARVKAEPEAAAELVRLCGALPLALRITTARLNYRPQWTLRYLVDRLRDESHRMEELTSGDRSVAATLRLSYKAMTELYRAAFRILVIHPSPHIDVHSAAALLHTSVRDAESILELLLDMHLLQQPDLGLYTFHDLVRSFARSLRGPSTQQDEEAAVERLLDYSIMATETACDILYPGRKYRPTGLPAYPGELPALKDTDDATRWFDRERVGLAAGVDLGVRFRFDRHAVCLTRNLVFQLNAGGHFEEFRELSRTAVDAARRLGDLPLLSVSLSNLGVAYWKLGQFEEGVEVAMEGREVAAALGDRHTEAHSDSTIGLLMTMLGRYSEALPALERAIELERELDSPRAEGETLSNLSTLLEQWGRYPEAEEAARRAIAIDRRLGLPDKEVMATTDLAFALLGMERYEEAAASLARARTLCAEGGPPGDVALVLALSAEVAELLGRPEEALAHAERALMLAQSSGTPIRWAKVDNILGRLFLRRGAYDSAMELHERAHRTASAIGYRAEEAYALCGMATTASRQGDAAAAARHRAAADSLFALMEVPDERRSR
ncbi:MULTISPECIES: BTAD domain-containing putative transcriptional regulator [unclassified Streptomyces]|uniref:AfsR/SARP family transcriptional regulator n=1 Tax=unclassified Streptomyces TaxID=2593676 RepID=UPI0021CD113D|nr:BTAD domain-containing putative transcriptional regulator [Streptomyces sp. sk2.1]